MCGIAGVIAPASPARDAAVDRARSAMGHRGPDGAASFLDDHVALCHTRLAIIDRTAASDQPMVDPETGSVLVFNGEIYNYRELRDELRAAGHRFGSAGDTEVLLLAYRQWGDRCVDHLNGMFAFAIWDPARDALVVARDRLGEKPLHLARAGGTVWFASEVKALIAAGAVQPAVDEDELFRYLAFADLGHPTATMFRGVEQLPAGHLGVFPRSGAPRVRRYWDVPVAPPDGDRHPVPADEIAALWADSVSLRLRSDVPVGTSLSGGVDSSAVVAMVRRLHPEGELHAFTASFPGSSADELPEAQRVADALGVTLHPVVVRPADLLRDLDLLHRANETPVEASSVHAQLRVMQTAADVGVVVMLDGQGGDEVFVGYDKYVGAHAFDLLARGRISEARRLRSHWAEAHGRPLHLPFARTLALSGGALGRRSMSRVALERSARWLSADYRRSHAGTDPIAGDDQSPVRPGRWSDALRRQDLARVTLPRLLRYGDRCSMAWSREVRLPYLDHRLVELAARIPAAQQLAGGWNKAPLRHLLDDLGLPQTAWRKDKKNFMPPQEVWLREGALGDTVAEAWADLHRAGLLASAEPPPAVLPRWRVLSAWSWARAFDLTL